MRKSLAAVGSLVLFVILLAAVPVDSAQVTGFEPVRAPFKGPENAPVTFIEIADFM